MPQPPIANSTVWVLPITIIPAAIRRRASVAVSVDRRSCQTCEPPVVTRPSISIRSLSAIGMPCSGPIAWPDRIALSAASAASRASAGVDLDKGVQLLVVRGDAREQRLDQFDRREPAGADLGG